METTEKKRKTMTKDEIIQELMEVLRQNQMPKQSNDIFEMAAYIDRLEEKLDTMTQELTNMQGQIKSMQKDTLADSLKQFLLGTVAGMEHRYSLMKTNLAGVKESVKTKAGEIITAHKQKGKAALNRVSEFLGVKKKLEHIRENVRECAKETDTVIAKIDTFGKGMREANQKIANSFRTFADKPEKDYSTQERKFVKIELLKKPWQAEKKLLASMELHLDAAIDKVSDLAMDMKLAKAEQEHTGQGVERLEGEVVDAPTVLVAEPAYKYGSEAFEKMMEQAEKRHIRENTAPIAAKSEKAR